jgi:hypothetical protein
MMTAGALTNQSFVHPALKWSVPGAILGATIGAGSLLLAHNRHMYPGPQNDDSGKLKRLMKFLYSKVYMKKNQQNTQVQESSIQEELELDQLLEQLENEKGNKTGQDASPASTHSSPITSSMQTPSFLKNPVAGMTPEQVVDYVETENQEIRKWTKKVTYKEATPEQAVTAVARALEVYRESNNSSSLKKHGKRKSMDFEETTELETDSSARILDFGNTETNQAEDAVDQDVDMGDDDLPAMPASNIERSPIDYDDMDLITTSEANQMDAVQKASPVPSLASSPPIVPAPRATLDFANIPTFTAPTVRTFLPLPESSSPVAEEAAPITEELSAILEEPEEDEESAPVQPPSLRPAKRARTSAATDVHSTIPTEATPARNMRSNDRSTRKTSTEASSVTELRRSPRRSTRQSNAMNYSINELSKRSAQRTTSPPVERSPRKKPIRRGSSTQSRK